MVMNGKLGYLHKNYRYTSGLTGRMYQKYFDKDTFFGKWLLSKNVAITINNMVFVHGGFSEPVMQMGMSLSEMTRIFRERIIYASDSEVAQNEETSLLSFENGPLWYRGCAQPYAFDTRKAERVLKYFNKDVLVIGHTSMPRVMGLYSNRIILVDSSIKFGKSGELLLVENGKFYTGNMEGVKKELIAENDVSEKKAIGDALMPMKDPIIYVELSGRVGNLNFKRIDNRRALAKIYLDNYLLDFTSEIDLDEIKNGRSCTEWNLRLKIESEQLVNFGFTDYGELLLLLPCEWDEKNVRAWMLEKNKTLPSSGFSYKTLKVVFVDESGVLGSFIGILLRG
jgi:hypothetical protein